MILSGIVRRVQIIQRRIEGVKLDLIQVKPVGNVGRGIKEWWRTIVNEPLVRCTYKRRSSPISPCETNRLAAGDPSKKVSSPSEDLFPYRNFTGAFHGTEEAGFNSSKRPSL